MIETCQEQNILRGFPNSRINFMQYLYVDVTINIRANKLILWALEIVKAGMVIMLVTNYAMFSLVV